MELEKEGNYVISTTTMALTEDRTTMEYRSRIYDEKGIFFSRKPPIELLNDACLERFRTYDSQIKAMNVHLDYYRKVPLIICTDEHLYAFPTCSPSREDCLWIFPRHVMRTYSKDKILHVQFTNKMKLRMNCSDIVFVKQQQRTSHCFHEFLTYQDTKKRKETIAHNRLST